jgi:hypothetical protein
VPDSQRRPLPDDIDFAQGLTSFTPEEQARLVRYTVRGKRLASCSFFERAKQGVNLNMSAGGELTSTMRHVNGDDDEAIDAMYQRLRIFYSPGRPTSCSFPRTIAMLREHSTAKGTPDSQMLLELLDQVVAWEEQAATGGAGIGMVTETRQPDGSKSTHTVEPREAFEDWMYGEHLHDDEDRLARISHFRAHGIHQFTALTVATDLANVYLWMSRHLIASHVLNEPALFEPSVTP